MISPNKQRIIITLDKQTIQDLDKVKGNSTRSEFIESAIYTLISIALLKEQNQSKTLKEKCKL